MTVSVSKFRADFLEFADTVKYPNSLVQFWLDIAEKLLPKARWLSMHDVGMELYAAHNVVLEAQAMAASGAGGIPGQSSGIMTQKHVDKVSVSYDATAAINTDAGHWNLTTYGNRFYRMMMMFGAGPVQVGVGPGCLDPLNSSGAWTGPDCNPGFTNFGN